MKFIRHAALIVACGLIWSCGGGGSSTSGGTTLQGTVATGRAYAPGAVITVRDSTGQVVATTTITSTDGTYSVNIPSSAQAPFIIAATEDDQETLYSIALANETHANVTPLTHLVVAQLATDGNPATLANNMPNQSASLTSTAVNQAIGTVNTLIGSVSTAASDNTALLTGTFAANGTGHDRVLDSLNIAIRPAGTSSNVEVSVRGSQDDTSQPVAVQFTLGQGASSTPVAPLPTVASTALPAVGLSQNIADLLSRVQACYAVPKANRTNGLTAANIIAPECTGVFYNSDPTLYKQNSYVVSSTEHYKGIFTKGDTYTVTFDQGVFQYAINNPNAANDGDVVFTWRAITKDANNTEVARSVDMVFARLGNDGKLYIIGNQSLWDASVDGRAEHRDFPHADFSKYSYLNVGYNIYVKNTGNIDQVLVTAPNNKTLLLKPKAGYSYLSLVKSNGTVTTTSVLRMAGQFINCCTANDIYNNVPVTEPSQIDSSLFWTSTPWSDTEIANIPNQGTWKFDYTLTGGTTFTLYRRTLTRAPTLAEAQSVTWPSLVGAVRSAIVSASASTGSQPIAQAQTVSLVGANNTSGWQVPAGAWAPTNLKVYGYDPTNNYNSFDDVVSFSTAARKATVDCSDQDGVGTADQHCTVNLFKTGVQISQYQLNGNDHRRLQLSVSINLRKN